MSQNERLRPPPGGLRRPPGERFVGTQIVLDLNERARALRAEADPPQRGHRQITLFHRPPVTQALFAFEAGGALPDHAARGLVTIHVLDGALTVEAEGQSHDLGAGGILVLGPNTRHSVRARDAATMLLTVHLETGGGGA